MQMCQIWIVLGCILFTFSSHVSNLDSFGLCFVHFQFVWNDFVNCYLKFLLSRLIRK